MDENLASPPHTKGPLTTKFGRLCEQAAYVDLLVGAALIIFGAAAYYSFMPIGWTLSLNGTNISPGFADSLYFSVVTFTTLGYGDYIPVGCGKFIAVFVVLCGLLLSALLIGKIASERHQAMLLLMFTSDAQRRLDAFTTELQGLRLEIKVAATNHDILGVRKSTKLLTGLLEAIFNYLIFNANQARLLEFGNASALKSLYTELYQVQLTCVSVHKQRFNDVIVSNRTFAISLRLSSMMETLRRIHQSRSSHISYCCLFARMIRKALRYKAGTIFQMQNFPTYAIDKMHQDIAKKISDEAEKIKKWATSHETARTLQQLYDLVPAGKPTTWPKDLHKRLARQLKVSNNLAKRCIDSLINTGKLPKP
ncbi:ion channel [Advenella incenata]|uniref:Ion channel n=1 Tax=Advenella incenata TaxID=267800 RepID=A0A4Q7VPB5_9BURK|nr:potassium channel family protein [Advenella incenata]RZT98253.1 ion channel [Advenella incenata]